GSLGLSRLSACLGRRAFASRLAGGRASSSCAGASLSRVLSRGLATADRRRFPATRGTFRLCLLAPGSLSGCFLPDGPSLWLLWFASESVNESGALAVCHFHNVVHVCFGGIIYGLCAGCRRDFLVRFHLPCLRS